MRVIDADNLKKRMSSLIDELGTTITDAEYKKIILLCIDNEPMCSFSTMKNIINYYENIDNL